MGLTQTKLHHRVLQENWPALCRRLQTPDGKVWIKTANPNGDYPLHLACYGGHAPPEIIRALIAAYPEALHIPNDMGFRPMDLAQSNYRTGHPFRAEVLEYLAAYAAVEDYTRVEGRDDVDATAHPAPSAPIEIQSISQEGVALPDHTYRTSATCVVCLERTADHVVIPCGHLCLCGDCAQKVLQGKTTKPHCPVGRCQIGSIAKVTMTPVEASVDAVPQCIPAL